MLNLNQLVHSTILVGSLLAVPAFQSSAMVPSNVGISDGSQPSSEQAVPQCGGDTKTDTKPKS